MKSLGALVPCNWIRNAFGFTLLMAELFYKRYPLITVFYFSYVLFPKSIVNPSLTPE